MRLHLIRRISVLMHQFEHWVTSGKPLFVCYRGEAAGDEEGAVEPRTDIFPHLGVPYLCSVFFRREREDKPEFYSVVARARMTGLCAFRSGHIAMSMSLDQTSCFPPH
jgi:hypothetical protein